jgi:hypothetical protein
VVAPVAGRSIALGRAIQAIELVRSVVQVGNRVVDIAQNGLNVENALGTGASVVGAVLGMAAARAPVGRTPMQWTIPINEGGAVNLVGRAGSLEIEVIANMRRVGNTIHLDGLHFTRNSGGTLGTQQLREFGRDFLRQHGNGATELVVHPAVRTTGANPGVAPAPITITLD